MVTSDSAPGRLSRDTFFARLRETADATAGDMLGERGTHCPYIERWFAQHATVDAAALERIARRYAGIDGSTTAEALIEAIRLRLRMGIAYWQTGEDLAQEAELAGVPRPAACACGTCESCQRDDSPTRVLAELGDGAPLDHGVRGRMERAFGQSFAEVRVHTESAVATHEDARAVTVGQQIAFAPGTYRPGTLEGDLLIAHELAHTSQQAGARDPAAGGDDARFEHEADRSAVLALLGARTAQVSRTGLRLQRCVAAAPVAGAVGGTAAGAGVLDAIFGIGLGGLLMVEGDTATTTTDETPETKTTETDAESMRRNACYAVYLADTASCGTNHTNDQVYDKCMAHAWQNYIRCLSGAKRIPWTG